MENQQDNRDKPSVLPDTIVIAVGMVVLWWSIDACYIFFEGASDGIVEDVHHIPEGKLKVFLGLIAFLCLTPGLVGEDGLGAIKKMLKKVITWHTLWEQKIANWVSIVLGGAMGWAYLSGAFNDSGTSACSNFTNLFRGPLPRRSYPAERADRRDHIHLFYRDGNASSLCAYV